MRFAKSKKLNLWFIDPFEILRRVVKVTYKLALQPKLSIVHPIFHVSLFGKYIPNESHVIFYNSMELGLNLTYDKELVAILDKQVWWHRTKEIASLKVLWHHRPDKEAIRKTEFNMHARYPHLFEALCTYFSLFSRTNIVFSSRWYNDLSGHFKNSCKNYHFTPLMIFLLCYLINLYSRFWIIIKELRTLLVFWVLCLKVILKVSFDTI